MEWSTPNGAFWAWLRNRSCRVIQNTPVKIYNVVQRTNVVTKNVHNLLMFWRVNSIEMIVPWSSFDLLWINRQLANCSQIIGNSFVSLHAFVYLTILTNKQHRYNSCCWVLGHGGWCLYGKVSTQKRAIIDSILQQKDTVQCGAVSS